MSMRKITIGIEPTARPAQASAHAWSQRRSRGDEPEPMKRLTIDVPARLHRQIMRHCAMGGTERADQGRELLLQKYGQW